MEAKVFPRKIEFYHFINSVSDKFDLKKSLNATENAFVTTDGKHVHSLHFSNFIENLNKELGTDFDEKASRQTPAGYVIVVKSEDKKPKQKDDKEEDKKETVTDQEEKEVKSHSEIDDIMKEAESLYDENSKKESKDKLADFATSKGVTLPKNQTFEDMLAQLKKELTSK